jgi:hypothetical protein
LLNELVVNNTTPAIRYSFPRSRFSIGAWNEAKEYAAVTSGATFKLYTLPYVNYQLTSSFSLNVGYEYEAHHNVGDLPGRFSTYQMDAQPGFVWSISKSVPLSPVFHDQSGHLPKHRARGGDQRNLALKYSLILKS